MRIKEVILRTGHYIYKRRVVPSELLQVEIIDNDHVLILEPAARRATQVCIEHIEFELEPPKTVEAIVELEAAPKKRGRPRKHK